MKALAKSVEVRREREGSVGEDRQQDTEQEAFIPDSDLGGDEMFRPPRFHHHNTTVRLPIPSFIFFSSEAEA